MTEHDRPATRIALLELAEERRTAQEGYTLLDEKRMLLAARILRQLDLLHARVTEWQAALTAACAARRAALERHGLQTLELRPVTPTTVALALRVERVLGVDLPHVAPELGAGLPAPGPVDPSPEAVACAAAWRALLPHAVGLAATECALWRLADEYARTERRTAAIEHVLLPELVRACAAIESALETVDQEEAVRVRRAADRRQARETAPAAGGDAADPSR